MADSYFQIATTPRLYVSYPLWMYATLGTNDIYDSLAIPFSGSGGFVSKEDHIKLMQLDPSNTITWDFVQDEGSDNGFLYYNTTKALQVESVEDSWNYDFIMFLGHNFASSNYRPKIKSWNGSLDNSSSTDLNMEGVVNHNSTYPPQYDGWSLANITDFPSDWSENILQIVLQADQTVDEAELGPVSLGSIAFGKKYVFPQNCRINTKTKFNYGVKQKQTHSGKTISNAKWTRPSSWIGEPFGLGESGGSANFRRSGLREWTVEFDSLEPSKVMPQNLMTNSNGYTLQDNHEAAANGTDSKYNINNGTDFFSSVVNRTLANHLPMVLQIDKDDYSPSGFALVRMRENYEIIQKSSNLYNIKVTFVEQV